MRLVSSILGFTLAGVVTLASANAADMALSAGPGGYKDAPWVPSWAGFYVGGYAGGAWTNLGVTDFDEDGNTFKNTASGAFGGGTVGYNWQPRDYKGGLSHWVMGPEIDFGYMGLSHAATNPVDSLIVSKIDSGFYMDATFRLGYAFDRTLIYAKSGYAYYGGSISINDIPEAKVKATGLSGWTAGGGVEYKLTPAWSLKGEYQYFDFETTRLVIPADGDRYDNFLPIHTFKAGVNYHFIPAYEPLK